MKSYCIPSTLAGSVILAAGLLAHAETPAVTNAYSTWFAALERLELPNVATAAYVCVENRPWWGPLGYSRETSGNAWMLSETREAGGGAQSGVFVVEGARVMEIDWWKRTNSRRYEDPFNADPPGRRETGTWRPAKLDRAIHKILAFLDTRKAEKDWDLEPVQGDIFLLAFQLHQRGDDASAVAILDAMFKVAGSGPKPFEDAVDRASEAQYENIYSEFKTSGDWRAFREGVETLLKRYPEGRAYMPGIALLRDRIIDRLSSPPLPAATNGLDRVQIELARRLLDIRQVRISSRYTRAKALWLLPSTWTNGVSVAGDLDLEIRALGINAIPLLLAMVDDKALTGVDSAVLKDDYFDFSPRSPRGETPREIIFDKMPRPATRGEVAMRILKEVLPRRITFKRSDEKSEEDICKSALEFYTRHATSTPEELAVLFLDEAANRDAALGVLLNGHVEKVLPLLQSYFARGLREGQPPDSWYYDPDNVARDRVNLLVEYGMARGKAALPLVDILISTIEKAAEDYHKPENVSYGSAENDAKHVGETKSGLHTFIAELRTLNFEMSTEQLLAGALRQTNATDRATEWLFVRLRQLPGDEALGLLLDKAVASKDPQGRGAIAGLLFRLAQEIPVGRKALNPVVHAAQWQTLIAADRTRAEAEWRTAELYLRLNEWFYSSSEDTPDGSRRSLNLFDRYSISQVDPAGEWMDRYGAAGNEFIRARVLARLKGEPEESLPAYPGTKPLSRDEIERVKSVLLAVHSRENAVEAIGKLSLNEWAALPGFLSGDAELSGALGLFANHITRVSVSGDPELQRQLADWNGKAVDDKLVALLRAHCERMSRAGSPVTCEIFRRPDFAGCEVTVAPPSTENSGEETPDEAKPKTTTGWGGFASLPGVDASMVVRTAPPPDESGWGKVRTTSTSSAQKFDQAVSRFLQAREGLVEGALIHFATLGDR